MSSGKEEQLSKRVMDLIGEPAGESRFEDLCAELDTTPNIVNEEGFRSHEFPHAGFALLENSLNQKCFAVFFAIDTFATRKGEFKAFQGCLVNDISGSDRRSSVRQKMCKEPTSSKLLQGLRDSSRWLRHDRYEVGNLTFEFQFDADTDLLAGLMVAKPNLPIVPDSSPNLDFTPQGYLSDPKILLAQIGKKYELCTSYEDSGTVVTIINEGTPTPTRKKQLFRTSFRGPNHFLFEWIDVRSELNQCDASAVWCHGGKTNVTFLGKQEEYSDLSQALISVAGVSSSASCLIPSLILPGLTPPAHATLTDLTMFPSAKDEFVKDTKERSSLFFLKGTLKPQLGALICVSKIDLTVRTVCTIDRISAAQGRRMTESVINELQSSQAATAEYESVIKELKRQLVKEHEDMRINTKFEYDSVCFNEDISDSRFFWKTGSYSELDWLKRGANSSSQ